MGLDRQFQGPLRLLGRAAGKRQGAGLPLVVRCVRHWRPLGGLPVCTCRIQWPASANQGISFGDVSLRHHRGEGVDGDKRQDGGGGQPGGGPGCPGAGPAGLGAADPDGTAHEGTKTHQNRAFEHNHINRGMQDGRRKPRDDGGQQGGGRRSRDLRHVGGPDASQHDRTED